MVESKAEREDDSPAQLCLELLFGNLDLLELVFEVHLDVLGRLRCLGMSKVVGEDGTKEGGTEPDGRWLWERVNHR